MAACGQKKTLDLARESFQNFDPQDLNTSDLLRHLTLRSWKSLSFCVESLAIQFSRSVSEADSGGAVGQLLGRISKLNLAPHQSVYNCVCVYFSTNLFCRHVQHPFTMAAPIAYSPLLTDDSNPQQPKRLSLTKAGGSSGQKFCQFKLSVLCP